MFGPDGWNWLGINVVDWAMLAIYLVGITAIGVYMVTRISDTADFFMAGRRQNRWFMMFFAFGAGTSGNDAVGVSSRSYTSGMSGIWYQWLWLFATPFYWLIAPVFRRSRCLTTGDFFEQRYDGTVGGLYSIVGVLQLTFNLGVLLLGGSVMVQAVSDGAIDYRVAMVVMTVLFVLYGIAGGLAAAIITDFIQGILTIILSFMLLPVALNAVGGFTGLRESIGDDTIFTIVSPGEINTFHIVMFGTIALVGIVTQPHIMGNCAAGRTENDGRFGFATGNLIKRFCTIPWMLVGICGIVLYPGLTGATPETSPDLVYGLVARDLLPTILPGLVGIFLAALLASIMSSCDTFMVSCSALFTQNFWRRYIVTDADEKHYLWVGRVASLGVVAGGLMFAFIVPDVPTGLEWFFRAQALLGAAFWLGLFWRRMTVLGAWASFIVGVTVMTITTWPALQPWFAANLPENMIWADKLRTSWSLFFYLSSGFLAAIVVSLVTKRVPEHKLEKFHAALRTPVMAEEPHLGPFELPEGVSPPPPRKLINHPDLEIPYPTRTGMVGFAIFWAWVVGLIALVYWIAGLGA